MMDGAAARFDIAVERISVPAADATLCVSDDWMAVTDPENERGEYVDALFVTSTGYAHETRRSGPNGYRYAESEITIHHLVGLTVEDTNGDRFIDRAEVINLMGADWVASMESRMDDET